jgi:serine/threonine protein kinase
MAKFGIPGYEKLGELGSGGFATVYKVRHEQLGYIRAIRVLNQIIDDESSPIYKSFLNECKILLRLGSGGHPNIVRITQPQLLNNHALVEMDYVKGQNLRDWMKKHKTFLETAEVLRFARDIGSALAYCHVDVCEFCIDLDKDPSLNDAAARQTLIEKYRICHNDLHSGNVIRKYDGSFILLDFGLSYQKSTNSVVRTSQRRGGILEYMAPEKLGDGTFNELTDIYSFGIMLYEALAGSVPFKTKGDPDSPSVQNALLEMHRKDTPPAIEPQRRNAYERTHPKRKYEKDYPDWLETVILKCLAKKPEDRYADGKELFLEIEANIRKDNIESNAEVRKLKAANEVLTGDLEQKTRKNDELNNDLNSLARQFARATFDADNAEILRLKDELKSACDLAIGHSKEIGELKTLMRTDEIHTEYLQAQAADLQKKLDASHAANTTLKRNVVPKSKPLGWIACCILLVAVATFAFMYNRAAISELQEENVSNAAALAGKDLEITSLKNEKQILSDSAGDSGGAVIRLSARIRELEDDARQNENTSSSALTEQTRQHDILVRNIQSQKTDLSTQLDSLGTAVRQKDEEIAGLQDELKKSKLLATAQETTINKLNAAIQKNESR